MEQIDENFSYDEETHTYYLYNKKIPSVSEIIAPLKDFSGISPARLENAAAYGKAVHKVIELYLNGTLGEYDPFLQQPLDEAIKYFDSINIADCGFIAEQKKYRIINGMPFAGTIDFKSDVIMTDYKTRKYNPIIDDLQMAFYEILDSGKYTKHILELIPNKPYNLVKSENRQARSMALYMLEHWHKNNEFQKKLEGWTNANR